MCISHDDASCLLSSDSDVVASSAHVAARAVRVEVEGLGRATRVAWKQGRVGVTAAAPSVQRATSATSSSGGSSEGGRSVSDRGERFALRLHRAVDACKQSNRRKALALCQLLLPSPPSSVLRGGGDDDNVTDATSALRKLRSQLGRLMRESGGWESLALTRVEIHTAWCACVRTAVLDASAFATHAVVRATVAEECAECFSSCSSTDPIASANALMVVGALAVALPLHDGLLGWLEGLHADLVSLVVADVDGGAGAGGRE
jgi:hypothetical protein